LFEQINFAPDEPQSPPVLKRLHLPFFPPFGRHKSPPSAAVKPSPGAFFFFLPPPPSQTSLMETSVPTRFCFFFLLLLFLRQISDQTWVGRHGSFFFGAFSFSPLLSCDPPLLPPPPPHPDIGQTSSSARPPPTHSFFCAIGLFLND